LHLIDEADIVDEVLPDTRTWRRANIPLGLIATQSQLIKFKAFECCLYDCYVLHNFSARLMHSASALHCEHG
jgi:hypothetical protein